MDERRLKYLYATLAVAFGLPSLVVGGAAATMLLLTGLEKWRTLALAKQRAATDADMRVMPVSALFGLKQPVTIYFAR